MLQLIGLIIAFVGSMLLGPPRPVNPDGISGGGPVGRPYPLPTPAIDIAVSHRYPRIRR